MPTRIYRAVLLVLHGILALTGPVHAGTVHAAVAANFTNAAEELAAAFEAASGHEVVLSFGATGAIYTQIAQGAPFDVFLAADDKRPAQAVEEGYAVAGSVFSYALGALALYGPGLDLSDGAAVLAQGEFRHLAIADPATAPYGAAAVATLKALGLEGAVASKLVTGQNIAQALQFVESGSAELGFVALGQATWLKREQPLPRPPNWDRDIWTIPTELYPAIRQDAVLLRHGEQNEAARDFLDYLKSTAAAAIVRSHGYNADAR
jgi:molybdate transport system substrate-binding protein